MVDGGGDAGMTMKDPLKGIQIKGYFKGLFCLL
jgi:hypothetical protein